MSLNRLVTLVLIGGAVIGVGWTYNGVLGRFYLNRPEPPLGIDNVTYVQPFRPRRLAGGDGDYGADSILAYCWPNSSKVTFQLNSESVGTFFGPVTVDFHDKNSTRFLYRGQEYAVDFCPDADSYYLTAFFFLVGPGMEVKSQLERGSRSCPEEFRHLIGES